MLAWLISCLSHADVLAFRENGGLIFCQTLECQYQNVRLLVLSVEMF